MPRTLDMLYDHKITDMSERYKKPTSTPEQNGLGAIHTQIGLNTSTYLHIDVEFYTYRYATTIYILFGNKLVLMIKWVEA